MYLIYHGFHERQGILTSGYLAQHVATRIVEMNRRDDKHIRSAMIRPTKSTIVVSGWRSSRRGDGGWRKASSGDDL